MIKTFIPIRFVLVFSTFLLTVLLYVDRACISAAKGSISTDLGFSMTQFGWIMAVFTLGYALFQTPAGRLADIRGARGVIAGIVTIWSILTAITGFAWNYSSMIVIRFLFGAGEAGAFPALSKDMTLSPSWAFCIDIGKENAGAVSGTMNMAGNLGAFVTIIAFPYLFKWTGHYEPFFYICAALSIVAILMWSSMNPEKPIINETKI